jgi:hypothetical protein
MSNVLTMTPWRLSKAKNALYSRTHDGFLVIVYWSNFVVDQPYGWCVKDKWMEDDLSSSKNYRSEHEAKTAALHMLEQMRAVPGRKKPD